MEILWEDADLIAVYKPVGLIVDAGHAPSRDDLVTRVRASAGGLAGGAEAGLSGAVGASRAKAFAFHRLDAATSGIVLLGKTRKYARDITKMFEEKRIRKAYLAVVTGEWTLSKVESPIAGQHAETTFRRLAVSRASSAAAGSQPGDVIPRMNGLRASLIEALPKTGRTHQIRIHCANSGHAILGDLRYGTPAVNQPSDHDAPPDVPLGDGQALHAYKLDFRHPGDGRTVTVRCEPHVWRETWLKDFGDLEPMWSKLFAPLQAPAKPAAVAKPAAAVKPVTSGKPKEKK